MQSDTPFRSVPAETSAFGRCIQRKHFRVLTVRAAMFDQLTNSLEAAWTKLRKEDVLTRENIKEPMRDIRRALLEADVSLPVVRSFVKNVTEKAIGIGVIKGVKPDQQLVKVVNDELVKLMGGEAADIEYAKTKPTVILMAGLQGVTACGKLALYLKKKGKKCMVVATDVYRPAAIDQLVTLGKQVDVPVFEAGNQIKPAEIAKLGLSEARKKSVDVLIVDTAGRLQVDKGMMDELKQMKKVLNPTEVLLVVDAMTGQEAAALVSAFNLEIGITGAILTKLDGDSRGGAALSVKEVSGKPIKFVGQGEGMEALELFYPDRLAGRILGMGDVLSFVEKAEGIMAKEEAEKLQKKIMEAKFDFNDFLKQTRALARMGPMNRVVGMLPGMGKVSPEQICEAEKSLKIVESMINSMTPSFLGYPVEEDWNIKHEHFLKNQVQSAILQGGRKPCTFHVFLHQSCISKPMKGDSLSIKAVQVSIHNLVKIAQKFLLCCKTLREPELLKTTAAHDWLKSIPLLQVDWKRKTVNVLFGFVMAGVLLMVGAPVTPPSPVTWALTEENLIFLEAWRTIDRAYIDKSFNGQSWFRYREDALRGEPMNNREQTYAAIRKMLRTLEDPFTRFLEPEKFKTLRTGTRGAVTGVGLEVGFDSSGADANLAVIAPVIGGPAERAGIVPGDIISEIDSVSTTGLGLYDAAQRLQGPESSEVKLTVRKKQSRSSRTLVLVRERIKINPVSWRLCEVEQEGKGTERIGYIRLATFNENASRSIKEAIQKLKESGATAFILDIRNNSGGLFPAGVEIARMWLEKGVIVYITDSMGVRDIYEADGTETIAMKEPLAVLVNKGTASASEILAGALKDNKRATILGEPTFGKGKIQSVFELSDGSGMAVTIARYETPAHVDIDKVGITPDHSLPTSTPMDKDEFCRCLIDTSLPCHMPPSTFFSHRSPQV